MRATTVSRAILSSLVLALLAAPAAATTLEGRWILQEQRYGRGNANLLDASDSLILEFVREGAALRGRLLYGPGSRSVIDWPALVSGERPGAVDVETLQVAPDGRSIRAVYSVQPAGDDLLLRVEEAYALQEDGALVGEVRVSFLRGEQPKGSYVLHRRFTRER